MPPGGASIGPAVPSEAKSGGSINETPPAEERTAKGKTKPASAPVRGKADEYLPAEYPLSSGNTRQDR